jgi:uroporphyrinogen-III synthase
MSVHALSPEAPRPGPLQDVGVLVTRPARQAAGLAAQLAALGASPILFPATIILPPADRSRLGQIHATLDRFDIAIFVSANAAEFGVPAPQSWPARLRTFAPGPGTAAALAAVGIHDVTIPEISFDSEGLLALAALNQVSGQRIAIFRGEGGRDLLGDTLRARGAHVEYADCYRRAAPRSGAEELADALNAGRIHALTITGSEGLDNLCALLDPDARSRLQRLPTFVPHPRIAEHARRLGFQAIATEGADAGLIAGLLEWFASHPLPRQ